MKKILLLMLPLLAVCAFSFAQAPTHKFTVDLVTPVDNGTIANGSAYTQSFIVTIDLGSLSTADTLGFADPFTQQGFIVPRLLTGPKTVGDTIIVNRAVTQFSGPTGPFNYCVAAIAFNRSANYVNDTTGTNQDCHSVTITGFPVSVGEFVVKENTQTQNITVYPNPATGNTINLDYVAQNTSNVDVKVYDLTGRTVLSKSFGKATKGQEGYGLDISAINDGMYILELRQDGIKATARFIK